MSDDIKFDRDRVALAISAVENDSLHAMLTDAMDRVLDYAEAEYHFVVAARKLRMVRQHLEQEVSPDAIRAFRYWLDERGKQKEEGV